MRQCIYDGEACTYRKGNLWECGASDTLMLECALKRIEDDNAVCLCGCPDSDHETFEEGMACEHEDHVCIRTCHAALGEANAYRKRIAELEATLRACHGCSETLCCDRCPHWAIAQRNRAERPSAEEDA